MDKRRIGIISFPLGKSNVIPLFNLANIIGHITEHVYIVTGNAGIEAIPKMSNIDCIIINYIKDQNFFKKVFYYSETQLRIAYNVWKISKKVDFYIFPIGGEALLPSMIVAKVLRKPVVMTITSSLEATLTHHKSLLPIIMILFSKINYFLSDKIILYSSNLINEWNLSNYQKKIIIAHRHFLDFDKLNKQVPLFDRPLSIGYIGRLEPEKGLKNLMDAQKKIFAMEGDIKLLYGGEGSLKEYMERFVIRNGFNKFVEFPGWISRNELPIYLNKFRLLILPSYVFEGLPNIILEAMACGTPVLATPVGAIPDVIIDGKTGFIMENNTPECIAESVKRALSCPELEEIAEAGRRYVEEEHRFEKVVERWKIIIDDMI